MITIVVGELEGGHCFACWLTIYCMGATRAIAVNSLLEELRSLKLQGERVKSISEETISVNPEPNN